MKSRLHWVRIALSKVPYETHGSKEWPWLVSGPFEACMDFLKEVGAVAYAVTPAGNLVGKRPQ